MSTPKGRDFLQNVRVELGGNIDADDSDGKPFILATVLGSADGSAEEHAAEIVRRCKAFPALVEALKMQKSASPTSPRARA